MDAPRGPVVQQRHRIAKRVVLSPAARVLAPWVLRAPTTGGKERAMRWVVWPGHVAAGRPFTRRVDGGFEFAGSSRDMLGLHVHLFGVWEPNLCAFLRSRLGPGRTFVDVGANSGWFTVLAARLVAPTGRVVAIEASPVIAESLRSNVARNGASNVRVVVAAAGRGPAEVVVEHGPAENTGQTRVLAAGATVHDGLVVPADALPALLRPEEVVTARVIKVDVEGAELDVVEGLAGSLGRFPTDCELVIEVGAGRDGTPERAALLVSRLRAAGYVPYVLPNRYDLATYVERPPLPALERLDDDLSDNADIVFSRIDAAQLEV